MPPFLNAQPKTSWKGCSARSEDQAPLMSIKIWTANQSACLKILNLVLTDNSRTPNDTRDWPWEFCLLFEQQMGMRMGLLSHFFLTLPDQQNFPNILLHMLLVFPLADVYRSMLRTAPLVWGPVRGGFEVPEHLGRHSNRRMPRGVIPYCPRGTIL